LDHKEEKLIPGKVSNRGKKESEIGVFFMNENNTLDVFCQFIPVLHHQFTRFVERKFQIEGLYPNE